MSRDVCTIVSVLISIAFTAVYGHEIEVILTHSTNTLTHLSLKHPAEELTRRGLASVILTFGHNLTHLNLDMPGEWDPQVKKAGKVGFPLKRKGYTASEPTYEDVRTCICERLRQLIPPRVV